MAEDRVNHPKHYIGDNGIECIDAMQAAFGKEVVADFCKCNAFKYLFRERMKQKGVSLQKAAWYLDKYKELMPEEIWVTCNENNAYEVSNKGNVRLKGSDNIRKPIFAKNGYATILTSNMGKPVLFYVHRLVASAFLPNPNGFNVVNHKDHNRANNSVENLEWCTTKYNVQHGQGRAVYVYDENKQPLEVFLSLRDAETAFGLSHGSIQRKWLDANLMCGNVYLYSKPINNNDFKARDNTEIEKQIEDLKKAIWYINDEIHRLNNDNRY